MAKEDVQIDMQEKTQAQLMQNYPQIKKLMAVIMYNNEK